MQPLYGYSLFFLSQDDQRASWPRYRQHNDDFIRTQYLHLQAIQCCDKHHQWIQEEAVIWVLTLMTDFFLIFCFSYTEGGRVLSSNRAKTFFSLSSKYANIFSPQTFLVIIYSTKKFWDFSISWFTGKCTTMGTCWSSIHTYIFF